ncbi:MAG: ComF family protein [Gammaproteobacteria bacterium]|jgi:ComF family protein|nr:phosphoribosyltransferase [Chromatiales bacterium]MCP4925145.1 ComF family protein [Gammaproteobacteria bacterium]MDP7152983.1 ComF family protein [Gammaproteobacteria bacterium]MDP7296503.1 ComF family protein [Gammaproteobacteria bacterium]MDP7418778.1 ComF family protein [Gammaproteobacteria bacterium]
MSNQVDRLLASLLPRSCVFCGQDGGEQACCEGCRSDLPWLTNPCRSCGIPLSSGYPHDYCGNCRVPTGRQYRMLSALAYEYPLDRIIAGAKFRQRLDFSAVLGELLAMYLCSQGRWMSVDLPDAIVPVPLHRRRWAARGFNQAAEIAAPVARQLGLSLRLDACHRVRHTSEQTTLSGSARRRNLVGAFAASVDLAGLRIAVVDDVLTTGATALAVATALKAAGARDTQIWTVARTV